MGFPGGLVVKNPPANAGNTGSNPGSGRSPGGGNGNPLQYSCLENPMDRGAWWATVHGIARVRHDIVQQLSSNNCILFYTSQYCTIVIFDNLKQNKQKTSMWDFPSGPVAKTVGSQNSGHGFDP